MKKRVFRARHNKVIEYSIDKPEIIPFDEGGFSIDENGDVEMVRIKKKVPKKVKKGE